jgi:hypothetical protein
MYEEDNDIFKEMISKYPGIFKYTSLIPNVVGSLKHGFDCIKYHWKTNKWLYIKITIKSFFINIWYWIRYKFGIPKKRLYLCSFGCGEGWYLLIREICEALNKSNGYILQVKEKFGGLRIYAECNEEIQEMIDKAEEKSYKICEECGTEENVTSEGGWIKTLCSDCRR